MTGVSANGRDILVPLWSSGGAGVLCGFFNSSGCSLCFGCLPDASLFDLSSLDRFAGFDVARNSSSSADKRFDLRIGSSTFRPGVENDILFRLFFTGSAFSFTSWSGTFAGDIGNGGADSAAVDASFRSVALAAEARGFRFLTRVKAKPSSSSSYSIWMLVFCCRRELLAC